MEALFASKQTKDYYRNFCSSEKTLPIYVQDWYLDAVCKDGEWNVILIRTEEEKIIASFTYFEKHKLGFHYVTMPTFVKWMGLYITLEYRNPKNEQKILSLILPLLVKFDAFKQNFHPNLINWSTLYWQRYQQTTFYTYQLDLSLSIEQLLVNCNRNIKRNIKKAKTLLQVKTDLSPQQFYEINEMSFSRQKVKMPYSLFDFLDHDKALQENKRRMIFYAKDVENNIHAASYIIWDQKTCYYHLSGENPSFRKSGASILLVWEAIRYAKEELNLQLFDFEGSMMPQVAHIRQQFGATNVAYSYIWKYNNSIFKLIDQIR
ncbi:MAG: GNAT family N-acetyltransferase [Bacteroidota bacterium]